MQKVLIITYYWPPTGGGGVYRWLKFVKYLSQYGWEPVVYTPSNPHRGIYDETLLGDVPGGLQIIQRPILEPYTLFNRLTGKKKDFSFDNFVQKSQKEGGSWMDKVGVWIRGNLFIPDARCLWIRPSVRFLTRYLQRHPVDVVVSTGTPHSMHLIGYGVWKRTGILWIADFRDPWTNIDFYHQLMLTQWADRRHRKLEAKVLQNATLVTTVSWTWAEQMKQLGARRVEVITNGFDAEDFDFLPVEPDPAFTIIHAGVMNADRNPLTLWKALSRRIQQDSEIPDFKLLFVGPVDYRVKQSLEEYGLSKFVEIRNYVPHSEVLQLMARASALLLVLNNTPDVMGRIPGKLYEYMASGRPILLIGPPHSDAASILTDAQAGISVDFEDEAGAFDAIGELIKWHQAGTFTPNKAYIEQFERKYLTKQLANILNTILEHAK